MFKVFVFFVVPNWTVTLSLPKLQVYHFIFKCNFSILACGWHFDGWPNYSNKNLLYWALFLCGSRKHFSMFCDRILGCFSRSKMAKMDFVFLHEGRRLSDFHVCFARVTKCIWRNIDVCCMYQATKCTLTLSKPNSIYLKEIGAWQKWISASNAILCPWNTYTTFYCTILL